MLELLSPYYERNEQINSVNIEIILLTCTREVYSRCIHEIYIRLDSEYQS